MAVKNGFHLPLLQDNISAIPAEDGNHGDHYTKSPDLSKNIFTYTNAYEPSHSGSDSPTQHQQSKLPRPVTASWFLEIGAVFLCVGSVVTIAVILYRENGQPLDRWELRVSLNTVISALGTLARITLAFALSACAGQQKWNWLYNRPDCLAAFERFDEASRGPWGGSQLFVWLRARHWAALGALVIMSTVAFDPFFQAIISVQGRLDVIPQASNATIGYAHNVSGGKFVRNTDLGGASQNDTRMAAGFLEVKTRPDFGLVGAIFSSLRNPSTALGEPASFDCVSGNCTWPVMSSAAICSSCTDVSDELEPVAGFGTYGVSMPWSLVWAHSYEEDYTTWTLPNANLRNYNARYSLEDTKRPQTLLVVNNTVDPLKTIAYQHLETMLMDFIVIRASDGFLKENALWNESRPIATECALYMCVNAYQTASINSELKEDIVGTWAQRDPDSFKAYFDDYDAPYNRTYEDARASSIGKTLYDANDLRTDLQLVIPDEAAQALNIDRRRFNVTQGFIFSTLRYMLDMTSNREPQPGPSTKNYVWTGVSNVGYPSLNVAMPMIVDALWDSANLTITFSNIARGLTNHLRNTSPTRAEGVTMQWILHVHVNWWYLLFPAVMLTLGILYVVLVIVQSTRLRLPVWKAKARPTLLYGLHEETQRLLREEANSKHASAVKIRYKMDETDGCLRLVAEQKE
ncbi:hypothetical protein OPT61_g4166 [Boeremia exigua]|uniref:Uncharacterized protein n=1 Tax=Boeremia exigua TaxID=749465 RepID=A0ACC2IF21_9PLEO|nr:hypothetical protein OPT61_g4166 [Boeremia exigua]